MPQPGNLAALISALGTLRPDAATAARIADILGIAWASEADEEAPPPSFLPPSRGAALVEDDDEDDEPEPTPSQSTTKEPEQHRKGAATGPQSAKLTLLAIRPTVAAAPKQVAALSFPEGQALGPVELPFEPLMRPVVTRALVSKALARRTATGPFDVARLTELMARRAAIRDVPRASWWGVAPWTRVLIDRGAGMAPFARDATDFAKRISAVASRERCEILPFWQTPLRVGKMPKLAGPMPLPRPATAVLAISDLGIAHSGSCVPDLLEHWRLLAEDLRQAGCPLLVFVPYPRERWPEALGEQLRLVPWDRRTSLSDVRSALSTQRSRR
ncbi:MAG TPA: hypothetical protein VHB79_22505 [Polyangiaceae bacterium]|nr:hypothetical protein [Polyangiaceae bacterium]